MQWCYRVVGVVSLEVVSLGGGFAGGRFRWGEVSLGEVSLGVILQGSFSFGKKLLFANDITCNIAHECASLG